MEDCKIARGRSPWLAAGYYPEGCRIGLNVRHVCRCGSVKGALLILRNTLYPSYSIICYSYTLSVNLLRAII
jgi:hypothetical protein